MAAVGVLLVSSGLALMATAGPSTAADGDCVPADAYTETVVDTAAVPAVPAVPAVAGYWQNFEPNKDQGTFTGPPTYPVDLRGTWSEPKTDGGPDQDASGVYQNGSGNSSWFYRSQGTPEIPRKPAVPAVTHQVDHPAVTCEVTPPVVEPPTTPQVSPPMAPTAKPQGKADPVTPTVVAAGLVGTTDTGMWTGVGLSVAGLVVIAGAAGLVLRRGGERRHAA
jgi:hypothetical protein